MAMSKETKPLKESLADFVQYVRKHVKGDERGESQVFLDRLLIAFGHEGHKEAGATLEFRVKQKGESTRFADLRWGKRVLIEMKKRGENLEKHRTQALDYWLRISPDKPRFTILCNFDEFWIYDFGLQLEPLDKLMLGDLPTRYLSLSFLLPDWNPSEKIIFLNNLVDVTREAADYVAQMFNSLIDRKIPRAEAQLFTLQCVFALFAEDIELLEKQMFTKLLMECADGASTFDLIGGLFRQMNVPKKAPGGRYAKVDHFNGGLFAKEAPLHLNPEEIQLLLKAAWQDWSKVQPHIFGTIFQSSMGEKERHAWGAHYTHEADILKVVLPTIVQPWQERLNAASTLGELVELRTELVKFRVLDPACGSGNFLYVAYRALKRLEAELIEKINANFKGRTVKSIGRSSLVSNKQFYGLDNNAFAVDLAKVTMVIAKKLAIDEMAKMLDVFDVTIPIDFERALPLDNLDENITVCDAVLDPWPLADAIIGNPPYQSKNKAQQEFGAAYLNKVRAKFPEVPGRADYCVYWFKKAHDQLPENGYAGLVGTNTIRQNYSRIGGLDYICNNGGTITEAISSQPWSGDAVVHVSIVNWKKGQVQAKKKLWIYDENEDDWRIETLNHIPPTLSDQLDVTSAMTLSANEVKGKCLQGRIPGNDNFLIDKSDALKWLSRDKKMQDVLVPYLSAENVFTSKPPGVKRYAIDFYGLNVLQAQRYKEAFKIVESEILPQRQTAAKEEEERNKELLKANPSARVNRHHKQFLESWWQFSYPRGELLEQIKGLKRYIVCSCHTKRPIFLFVDKAIHPNNSLMAFCFEDNYSFGILQSSVHWAWFVAKCSTIKADPRYTSESIFDTFPWPQNVTKADALKVAKAAENLVCVRDKVLSDNNVTLRQLYRALDVPGKNPLRTAHEQLDSEVMRLYGMKRNSNILSDLLELNQELARLESQGLTIEGPGLPASVKDAKPFITTQAIFI